MSPTRQPYAVIVDDEQSYLDLLAVILQEHLECPVATFARPIAALEAMKSLEVGIIVTDFYMPDIDGVEFLRRAAQIHPHAPAIMITGHAEALDGRGRSSLTNLKAVLAKPFGAQVLADHIRRYWLAAGTS